MSKRSRTTGKGPALVALRVASKPEANDSTPPSTDAEAPLRELFETAARAVVAHQAPAEPVDVILRGAGGKAHILLLEGKTVTCSETPTALSFVIFDLADMGRVTSARGKAAEAIAHAIAQAMRKASKSR